MNFSKPLFDWQHKIFFGNESEMSRVLCKNVIFWWPIGKSVFISDNTMKDSESVVKGGYFENLCDGQHVIFFVFF